MPPHHAPRRGKHLGGHTRRSISPWWLLPLVIFLVAGCASWLGQPSVDAHNLQDRLLRFRARVDAALSKSRIPRPQGVDHEDDLAFVVRHARFDLEDPSEGAALVRLLAADPQRVNKVDRLGLTPLHYAVAHKEMALAEVLLEAGADAGKLCDGGRLAGASVLHLALGQFLQDTVVISKWALSTDRHHQEGIPRHQEQSNLEEGVRRVPELQALAREGAKDTIPWAQAAGAAHAWANHFLALLLPHAGRLATAAEAGFLRTPLHFAALAGNAVAVRMLGGKEGGTDRLGHTPAHLAALKGHYSLSDSLRGGQAKDILGRGVDDVRLPNQPARWIRSRPATSSDSNGGWSPSPPLDVTCDIPVVENVMDSYQFFAHFLSVGRPVLIKDAASKWDFRRHLSREALLGKMGDAVVEMGGIPYASAFGRKTQKTTLSQFIQTELPKQQGHYVFQRVTQKSRLMRGVPMPPPFLADLPAGMLRSREKEDAWAGQFYLGGEGSGAPAHFHSDAWNALAFGRKRWWLTPPSKAEYSVVTPNNTTTVKNSMTCIQEAGDVLYIPAEWGHSTLNLQPAVGVAVEFRFARGFL